jgi:hypothetical protein
MQLQLHSDGQANAVGMVVTKLYRFFFGGGDFQESEHLEYQGRNESMILEWIVGRLM